jgi:hypothetical protein
LAGCCGVDDRSKADVAQVGYWIEGVPPRGGVYPAPRVVSACAVRDPEVTGNAIPARPSGVHDLARRVDGAIGWRVDIDHGQELDIVQREMPTG